VCLISICRVDCFKQISLSKIQMKLLYKSNSKTLYSNIFAFGIGLFGCHIFCGLFVNDLSISVDLQRRMLVYRMINV
jgi:hypothetical protein